MCVFVVVWLFSLMWIGLCISIELHFDLSISGRQSIVSVCFVIVFPQLNTRSQNLSLLVFPNLTLYDRDSVTVVVEGGGNGGSRISMRSMKM